MTLATSRRQPGKLKADRIGLLGTAMLPRECLRPEVGQVVNRHSNGTPLNLRPTHGNN
jgi:hypothetical protein